MDKPIGWVGRDGFMASPKSGETQTSHVLTEGTVYFDYPSKLFISSSYNPLETHI